MERKGKAWGLALLCIPATLAVVFVLSVLVQAILPPVMDALPWALEAVADEFLDAGLVGVLESGAVIAVVGALMRRSARQEPVHLPERAMTVGALALLLTAAGAVLWLLRGLPVLVNGMEGITTVWGMLVAAAWMFRCGWQGRRDRRARGEKVLIFVAVGSEPNPKVRPFLFCTGGEGVLRADGGMDVGQADRRLDTVGFNCLKDMALRVLPEAARGDQVMACGGTLEGDRAVCTDLFWLRGALVDYRYVYAPDSPKKQPFVLNAEELYQAAPKTLPLAVPAIPYTAVHVGKAAEPEIRALLRAVEAPSGGQEPPSHVKPAPAPAKAAPAKAAPAKPTSVKAAPVTVKPAPAEAVCTVVLMADSTLTEAERALVRQAAAELKALFPMCRVQDLLDNRVAADGMQIGARNARQQLDCDVVMDRLSKVRDTLAEWSVVLLVTGHDCCMPKVAPSWCFGGASCARGAAVISLARTRGLPPAEHLRVLRRTLRHELGHLLGMPSGRRTGELERAHGLHCTHPGCSMRQTGTLEQLRQAAAEEDRMGLYFCDACRADRAAFVQKKVSGARPGPA